MNTAVRACLMITMGLFVARCGTNGSGSSSNTVILPDGGNGSGGNGHNGGGNGNGNGGDGGNALNWGPDGSSGNPSGELDGGADPWNNADGAYSVTTHGLDGGGSGTGGDGSVSGGPGGPGSDGGAAADGALATCGTGLDGFGCPCIPGTRQYCYTGPASQAGVAGCNWGEQVCTGGEEFGTWGPCTGCGHPTPETCDGEDNNCDGVVDEGCPCTLGASMSCYTGPPGVPVLPPCHAGTETCVAGSGSAPATWTACTGEVTPMLEVCDGIDNNCNGIIDEGCICRYGATQNCYTGPAGTEGVGACLGGIQTCMELPDGGSDWGACVGEVTPTAPTCGSGCDSMCDGHPDEGCPCRVGTTESCYDGPHGTSGVGICHAGSSVCSTSGWGPCIGEQTPEVESCNGLDDNCTGVADEWCLCGTNGTVTFTLRNFAPMGDRSDLSPGDGLPLMTQSCGPMICPSSEVAAETAPGVFACVAPPPICPAGTYANYVEGLFWRCDPPCQVIVTYGPIFGDLVECAPFPTISCPGGEAPYYAYETETWVCRPVCNNGEYDLYHLGSIPVCIPC